MTNQKIKIEFTFEDINNLITFLNRTDLKGNEVPAFNSIMFNVNNEVRQAQQSQQPKQKEAAE